MRENESGVVHTCNFSTLEADAGGSPQVRGHPGLHSETLTQNTINWKHSLNPSRLDTSVSAYTHGVYDSSPLILCTSRRARGLLKQKSHLPTQTPEKEWNPVSATGKAQRWQLSMLFWNLL